MWAQRTGHNNGYSNIGEVGRGLVWLIYEYFSIVLFLKGNGNLKKDRETYD